MTATTTTPGRPGPQAGPAGFGQLLRAEWIKFRTVRGWVIGNLIATLVTVGIALLNHSTYGGVVSPGHPASAVTGCLLPWSDRAAKP